MAYYDENRDNWTIDFPVAKLIDIIEQRLFDAEAVVNEHAKEEAAKPVARKRLGWLGDLLGLNTDTSGIFGNWEEEYQHYKSYDEANFRIREYKNWLMFLGAMYNPLDCPKSLSLNIRDVLYFQLTQEDLNPGLF